MVRNTGMAREETNKVRIENKSKQTKCLIMVGTSPSSTFYHGEEHYVSNCHMILQVCNT